MGRFLKAVLAAALVVPLLVGSAAAYDENLELGKQRAYHYILLLKEGYGPALVDRPVLPTARTWQGKYARRQMIKGMDTAEELADQGLHDLIPDPVWIYQENWIYADEPEEESSGY